MFVGEKASPNIPGAAEDLGRAKQQAAGGQHMPHIFKQTGWFQAEDGQWRREVPDKDMKLTGRLKKGGGPVRIDEAIDHKKLFEADPDLRCSTVEVKSIPGFAGGYDPNKRRIYVEDPNDIKTIMHEKQHDIQYQHGLTPGTLPETAGSREAYLNNTGEREARDVEARLKNNDRQKKPALLHKAG